MRKNLSKQVGFKLMRVVAVVIFCASTSISVWASPIQPLVVNNLDGTATLTRHVPKEVATATLQYHALSSEVIKGSVILPLQHTDQLNAFLKDVYNPKSPNFHHFLKPKDFAQAYGASSIDVQNVTDFLTKQGILVTGQSSNGAVLKITGPVPAFEKALGVKINHYLASDGVTSFFAPDQDPKIPVNLVGKILAFSGLDNVKKLTPLSHALPINPLVKAAFGTGPGGYLAPSDVKTAYNLNALPSNGSGQTMALAEFDGYYSSDINVYEAKFGLPQVPLQNILLDGFSGVPSYPNPEPVEVTLDIELMTAFAPGTSKIYVYEDFNNDQAWISEWTQMADDDVAKIISCSWADFENYATYVAFDDQIFPQLAAQGQAVFQASGDFGAYDSAPYPKKLGVLEPAGQPYLTDVGISVLNANPDWSYKSETGSSNSGGGISALRAIPDYQLTAAQQANPAALVSTTNRNVPDVAFTADGKTMYSLYIDGSWQSAWGASLAAPIWASFMSCVNQGLGQNGPLGFANPMLYQLAQTSNYSNDFHDISGGNNGYFPAEPGFDDVTGLGSFNGLNLFNDILSQFPNTLPAAPTNVSTVVSDSQVILKWNASQGANYYKIQRSTVSGSQYTVISTSDYNTTFTDNAVTNGTTYYYVVSAINASGESPVSSEISATPVMTPSVPTGLTTSAANAQIYLSWNAVVGATSYNVKRSTISGGPYTPIISNIEFTNYLDKSLPNDPNFYYVVSANNKFGESMNSQEVLGKLTPPPAPVVKAPIGVNGGAYFSSFSSPGAFSYNVKLSTISHGPYKTVVNTPLNNYTDDSLINGNTYYFVVSAVNAGGESPNSQEFVVTLLLPPATAPQGFTPSLVYNGVHFTWEPLAGAGNYLIYRYNPGAQKPILVCQTVLDQTSCDDFTAKNNTSYHYDITAENIQGAPGPVSQVVLVTTPVFLSNTPYGLTAVSGNGKVSLSWKPVTGATMYHVLVSNNPSGPFSPVATTINLTSYTDHNVTNGNTYYYAVTALSVKVVL